VNGSRQQKQEKSDEFVQLIMGVLLIAFAVVAVAVLLAIRVSEVLTRY